VNTDEAILAELRKMGAWADRQRKMSKWGLIVAAVIFPAMIIFSIVTIHQTETKLEHISVPENHDWCDVVNGG